MGSWEEEEFSDEGREKPKYGREGWGRSGKREEVGEDGEEFRAINVSAGGDIGVGSDSP